MTAFLFLFSVSICAGLSWLVVFGFPRLVCLVTRVHLLRPWRHPTRGIVERCDRCGAVTPLLRAVK